jgi:hypothetical protein
MSDIENTTEVILARAGESAPYDNTDVAFFLKCEDVEVSVGNNLVARAILSAAGDIAGADPVLNSVTYQLTGIRLQAISDDDYPDEPINDAPSNYYGDVATDDHNERMMIALKEAAKQWGPDANGDIDRLVWGGQTIPVVITSFSAAEGATAPKPGIYTADLELTHISAYVG